MPIYYIGWIRHCESCANVSENCESECEWKHPAFCTKTGILNSLHSGNRIRKLIDSNFNSFSFFSSHLPRAMETAKLASDAFKDASVFPKKILRLPYITERWGKSEIKYSRANPFNSTTNTTTLGGSIVDANNINSELFGIGLEIETSLQNSLQLKKLEDELADEKAKVNINESRICFIGNDAIDKIALECRRVCSTSYTLFKEKLLGPNRIVDWISSSGENHLNLVVSHGWFIRTQIIETCENYSNFSSRKFRDWPDNNEMWIIRYEVSEGKDDDEYEGVKSFIVDKIDAEDAPPQNVLNDNYLVGEIYNDPESKIVCESLK